MDNRLNIKNNSENRISVEVCQDSTLTINDVNHIEYYLSNFIEPDKEINESIVGGKNEWDNFICSSTNKKLNIFFFNLDTLKKYNDFNIIISNKMYQHYEFTKQELEQLNWQITYSEK
ncbi:MAG: hypothetical protein ACM3UU_02985 [Ignavibacteriales bacterium]